MFVQVCFPIKTEYTLNKYADVEHTGSRSTQQRAPRGNSVPAEPQSAGQQQQRGDERVSNVAREVGPRGGRNTIGMERMREGGECPECLRHEIEREQVESIADDGDVLNEQPGGAAGHGDATLKQDGATVDFGSNE